jgi:hypothetical protein
VSAGGKRYRNQQNYKLEHVNLPFGLTFGQTDCQIIAKIALKIPATPVDEWGDEGLPSTFGWSMAPIKRLNCLYVVIAADPGSMISGAGRESSGPGFRRGRL